MSTRRAPPCGQRVCHALPGTPEQIIAQIRDLGAWLPIDPLIVCPQWPVMPTDDAIALLDALGRDVVPAIREIVPVSTVE